MASKTVEFRRIAVKVLEEDLGMEVVDFGVRGGGHHFIDAQLDGKTYRFSCSSTPGNFGRAGLRSDFRRRLAAWMAGSS